MDEMHVAVTKSGKRKWSLEQKMGIIGELNSGVDAAELCRKYNIHAQMLYKWRRTLEFGGKEGLKAGGEIVAKGQYQAALKKIEELERALGRKTLELDILKKSFELKGLKLPEGI
jgi:transposase